MDERLKPETAVGVPALGRELGAVARRRARSRLVSSLRANGLASFGVLVLLLVCLSAIFADVLAPHNPRVGDLMDSKLPPAFLPGGDPRFILGTDELGRDSPEPGDSRFPDIPFGGLYGGGSGRIHWGGARPRFGFFTAAGLTT